MTGGCRWGVEVCLELMRNALELKRKEKEKQAHTYYTQDWGGGDDIGGEIPGRWGERSGGNDWWCRREGGVGGGMGVWS